MIIEKIYKSGKKDLEIYRKEALVAAHELYYSDSVIQEIKDAVSEPAIIRALARGRHEI